MHIGTETILDFICFEEKKCTSIYIRRQEARKCSSNTSQWTQQFLKCQSVLFLYTVINNCVTAFTPRNMIVWIFPFCSDFIDGYFSFDILLYPSYKCDAKNIQRSKGACSYTGDFYSKVKYKKFSKIISEVKSFISMKRHMIKTYVVKYYYSGITCPKFTVHTGKFSNVCLYV